MQISDNGLNFTTGWEGFVSCPYWDPYGKVWTRGIGETDFHGNFNGKCITLSEAKNNLRILFNDVYGKALNDWLIRNNIKLNQNQFDSGCDILYNLGTGALEWNIFRSIKEGKFYQAANEMLEYRFAGGVELPGLRRRREGDRALFLKHVLPPPNPLAVLEPNERLRYDEYKKFHKKWQFDDLVLMRKNIYEAATNGRLYTDKKKRVQKGWKYRNRYARYQLLKKITS
jgi:lysozyme